MAGIAATKFWIALNAILLSAGKLRQQVVSAVMQTPVPWGGAPHVEAYFKRTPHALAYTGVGSGMPGMRAAAFEYRTRCPALVRGESLIHSCRSIWLYIQTLSPNSTASRHHRSSDTRGLSLECFCLERPQRGPRSARVTRRCGLSRRHCRHVRTRTRGVCGSTHTPVTARGQSR